MANLQDFVNIKSFQLPPKHPSKKDWLNKLVKLHNRKCVAVEKNEDTRNMEISRISENARRRAVCKCAAFLFKRARMFAYAGRTSKMLIVLEQPSGPVG